MAINEGARKDGKFMVVCIAPDVCLTPPVPVPVPYQIVAFLDNSMNVSPNVRFTCKPALMMKSRGIQVIGDEAGSAGGVKSGVNVNHCRPVEGTHSTTVRVNGEYVLYHDGYMYMNCAGPEGAYNTLGKIVYLGPSSSASVSPDGETPSADPPVTPETPQEKEFLNNLGQSLTSPQGFIGLLQQGQQLAQMDWKNPGAVLGTFGGMAGLVGLDPLAKAASLGAQGYQLTKMEAIMGAAAGLAGQFLGGGMVQMAGTVSGMSSTLLQTGQNDSQLTALSKNIWKPSIAVIDTEMIPMMRETDPKIMPETEAEKWTSLSKTICRIGNLNFDPDLPKFLPIDEKGQIVGQIGFEFSPETLIEKQLAK
ncbi:hypothetical protein THII_3294 [Thioploca ingrica]|uniref:Uncharacterized protein n=1 Tax=Thioploca ingrica TaxID=40754 RepID=A0A090BVX0_9GAMM|nr:hypothetical protein THII_3294 [Thioploca ingrica]